MFNPQHCGDTCLSFWHLGDRGRGSEVQSQSLLRSKFQASLDYVRSCQQRKQSNPKEAEGGRLGKKGRKEKEFARSNNRAMETCSLSAGPKCEHTPREMEQAIGSVVGGANSHSGWKQMLAT